MIVLDYVIWYLLLALEWANWLSQGKSSHLQTWTCLLGPHNQQCCLIVIGNIEYLRLLTGVHHHLPTFGASWILSFFQFDIFPWSMIWALEVYLFLTLIFWKDIIPNLGHCLTNAKFQLSKVAKTATIFLCELLSRALWIYGPFWGDAVVASPHSGLATPHGKVAISVGPYVFVKVPLLVLVLFLSTYQTLFERGE